ncbi:GNAT family acetyltransferase [Haloferax sp. ATCC BAA-646]|nr:GNAT family acetyltransferase [Haloferax sp. ATCC BAA-646]
MAYAPGEAETVELGDLDVTIRMAQNVDLESLVDAIHEVADEGRYIEAETVADLLDHEEVVLRHNEVSSRMVFVATVGDELAGWVHLDLPEAEKLSHTAVLTVGTRPEFRGHGIGSKLLDRGVDWARERGFEKLYNSVPATNEEAIAFLEGHGWETEAVRDAHYKIDGDYVDEVMMAVSLR